MSGIDPRLAANKTAPVLAGIDGTPGSFPAIRWAVLEAVARGVPLDLVHIYERARHVARDAIREAADFALTVLRERNVRTEIAIATVLHRGSVRTGLAEVSGEACLLVLATRGIARPLSGLEDSTSSAMLRHAHCPLVVVPRTRGGTRGGDVVLGIDGAEQDASIRFAFEHADREQVKLVAVHAFTDGSPSEADRELAHRLDPWLGAYPGVWVRREVAFGQPVRALLTASEQARLLVLGSRGAAGLSGLLAGSVSQAVLYQAELPVAVVRA